MQLNHKPNVGWNLNQYNRNQLYNIPAEEVILTLEKTGAEQCWVSSKIGA